MILDALIILAVCAAALLATYTVGYLAVWCACRLRGRPVFEPGDDRAMGRWLIFLFGQAIVTILVVVVGFGRMVL